MDNNKPAYLQTESNEFGQFIGSALPNWQGVAKPPQQILAGEHTELIPMQFEQHADSLWALIQQEPDASCWTYLPYGSFATQALFSTWLKGFLANDELLVYAILSGTKVVGWCALMRADVVSGSVEIGHVYYSASLRQSYSATEAMFLLMQQVFSLGYRRCEWKCDDLNAPSKKAALRLGFSYEGVFRQAVVVKGRNRNTAWFSILDSEWPSQSQAMQKWLKADNFDSSYSESLSKSYGQQKQTLQQLRKTLQD